MNSDKILKELKKLSSPEAKTAQLYFKINNINSYGLRTPQLRALSKRIGKNHELALELWQTGIHEAKHLAIFIADPQQVTEDLMESWLQDFDSWDIVDNSCGTLFDKTPLAFSKAMEWCSHEGEFQKRAGFTMMAELAVHDKKSNDKQFEQFFPFIIAESADERNFVKKAVNWALRQIGKRNERLCKKAIAVARKIQRKGDPASKWIAADALRELLEYQKEGKIKKIGTK